MSKRADHDWGQELPKLQGHVLCIMNSQDVSEQMTVSLNAAGFKDAEILVFSGDEGMQLVKRLMEGSQWGEGAEEFLGECIVELEDGRTVVCVKVDNDAELNEVSTLATQFGGHGIYHFGLLVDTRLTR